MTPLENLLQPPPHACCILPVPALSLSPSSVARPLSAEVHRGLSETASFLLK